MGALSILMVEVTWKLHPGVEVLLLLMVSLGLALVGLVDDVRGLPPGPRFGAQVMGSVVLAFCFVLTSRQPWAASTILSLAAIVGASIWLTGFTNAYNFMDGINGIAGVTAVISASWFTYLALAGGLGALAGLCVSLAGASLGFLLWNYPRARFFLGDVGSYAVGTLLGGVAIILVFHGGDPFKVVAPLSIYLADTTITLARRIRVRAKVWVAHREHVYQRLTDSGVPSTLVTAAVGFLAVVACTVSAKTHSDLMTLVLLLAIAGVYVLSPHFLGTTANDTSRPSRFSS